MTTTLEPITLALIALPALATMVYMGWMATRKK